MKLARILSIMNNLMRNLSIRKKVIQIYIPQFGIENDFFELDITPGVYELVDIKIPSSK